ncbi:MAG: hypothetical protein MUF42_07475 [Cytophagaceae bacterium]|jgi:tetratricopeptide (TPR) repeat protein|nr:hypothetical protein [Cytophagaceae bacterium]
MKIDFFKRVVQAGFMLVLMTSIYGQNGVLTNAILLQREGDLEKALVEINKASEHEKTKGLAKTWYYKGLIYQDIYISENSPAKTQVQDALLESTEFFQKAVSLDAPNGEYRKMSQERLSQNYVEIINRGASQYQVGKMQQALSLFAAAQRIKPRDTTAYTYAYGAAFASGDKIEQKRNLDSIRSIVPNHYLALARLLNYHLSEKEYNSALNVSQAGMSYYPKDKDFQYGQFLSWMGLKKTDEAQTWLQEKIKTSPFSVDYVFWQALLHKENKNQEQELIYYQKVIALEPYHFIANYNSALVYVDKGNEMIKKNDAGYKQMFSKALEYARKARTLGSDEEKEAAEDLIKKLESYQ